MRPRRARLDYGGYATAARRMSPDTSAELVALTADHGSGVPSFRPWTPTVQMQREAGRLNAYTNAHDCL
jgi:hypothetical protein